ncbi:MAG: DUF2752 domain-containing protein [Planctomycetota bacterium]
MQDQALPATNPEASRVPPRPIVRFVRARLGGFAVFASGALVLVIAAGLNANPTGIGTHTQLGLSPCGFKDRTGLPCATCGMTTATTLAADGRFFDSIRVQPGGFLFAVGAATSVIVGGWSVWTGRSLLPLGIVLVKPKSLVAIGVVLLLAWTYRIADTMLGTQWNTLGTML